MFDYKLHLIKEAISNFIVLQVWTCFNIHDGLQARVKHVLVTGRRRAPLNAADGRHSCCPWDGPLQNPRSHQGCKSGWDQEGL